MNILNVENVSKTYMSRDILKGINLGISDTDKIGVVGVNGCGKSTLLRIVAGVVSPDDGKVVKGNDIRISYLPQTDEFDGEKPVIDNVTACIYQGDGHWDKSGEIKAMLAKFRIDDPMKKTSLLSGGERKRAALVAALLTPCDLLVLDEPTNHLDLDMIEWLEGYLKSLRAAIFMVTHDRYFLDSVTDQIVEVDRCNVYRYSENYSGYLELKAAREASELATYRKKQSLYRIDLEWMMRGARARSTKQKAHIKRFEELSQVRPPEEERALHLGSLASRMGNKTIIIEGLSMAYGDKKLFSDFSYTFTKLDRIGIVGINGCGKSTLMKCIMGLERGYEGKIEIGQTIRIGYFGQDCTSMDPNERVIDYVKDIAEYIKTPEGTVTASAMCERFLFDGNMQYAPIGKLSGGEKRRLYLLSVLMTAPNVLILDEPTNDFDIKTLQVLEEYLDEFAGIIITVSHDRYFLDRVVTRIFAFEDGTIRAYEGAYSDYYAKSSPDGDSASKVAKKSGDNQKKDWKGERVKKKLSYAEQKEYDSIEGDIEALEQEADRLKGLVSASASDFVKLMEYTKALEEVNQRIDEKLERYVELQEMVENFT